jgi:hypothetical protein
MSELLTELAAAGRVEGRGGFTIDSEKAREKLRHYQLADPHRYVLLLVEAAVLLGADELEFEIDSDDVHLRFAGAQLVHAQLENIYATLFAQAEQLASLPPEQQQHVRGLQQLAFALNSAMALNPRFARVVSVGPDGNGTALELRPSAADELQRVEGQPPGNHIHVKDRFRIGLVVEFLRKLDGRIAEAVLLREHCRWSRIPVYLNGASISEPIEFPAHAWSVVDVVDDGRVVGRAALGLHAPASDGRRELERPSAQLLCNGVSIETCWLEGRAVLGFRAIVDSRRLSKDVSQTKLVQDAELEAVLARVCVAQDQLIHRLADRRAAGAGAVPDWAEAVLLEWLRLRVPKRVRAGVLQRLLDEDEVFAAVAAVPLWLVIGAAAISTRTMIESEQAIRYATMHFEHAPIDVPFVLRASPGVAHALLEQLFGDRLQDYTEALQRESEREHHRLAFKARRHSPELDEGHYLIREPIRGEVLGSDGEAPRLIRGELGLRVLDVQRGWLRLLSEGCVLCEHTLDGPIPGLYVVVEAPLTANEAYDDVRPTPALAVALTAVLAALERALARLARSGGITAQHVELRALLRLYIQQVCRRDYATAFLTEFGFTPRDAKRALERLAASGAAALRPVWGFVEPREAQHPFVHVPLYDRTHGPPASLAELSDHRAHERIAWLEPGHGPLPLFDRKVLLLEQPDREVLRELFGSDALEPFAEQLTWLRRRDAFLERQPARLAHTHAALVDLPFTTDPPASLRGSLGLREYAFTAAGEGHTPVRVHYRERELCEIDIELPFPGLIAWVDSDAFELSPTFDALAQPMTLRRPLLLALAGLCERELGRLTDNPSVALRCEWWFLGMIPHVLLGEGSLGQVIVALRCTHDRGAVLEQLAELLELQEQFPARDLDRAVMWLRGRKQVPTAAAVRERLARPSRKLTEADHDALLLRRSLLPVFGRLLEMPLYRRFEANAGPSSTRNVSFDELLVQVAGGRPISWVGDDFRIASMPKVDIDIVILDPIEQRLLDAVFGSAALELVSDWLIGRAQFERRRTTDEVRVARGSALVVRTIDAPHIRGELGISRQPPGEALRSKIRLFTEAREIAVLDVPARPLALVGALDVDDLELNAGHDDITADARERMQRFVADAIDPLIVELADRYETFERRDKTCAAEIVRHLLAEWPPGAGGFRARAATRPSVFRRLADLPVFPGARKPWSAIELAEARERDRIATLTYRRPALELPDMPVVVLETPEIERAVSALFGELRDLEQELQRRRELDGRKASAPKLPSPPKRALVTIDVEGEGLLGVLWLHERDDEIRFGEDGLVIESRVLPTACGCAGAIWGPQLSVAMDWSRIVLSRAQERLLERLACDLWDRLLDELERHREQASPDDDVLERLREAAHGLFSRLLAQLGPRRRSKRKAKQKQGNRQERLYARVWSLPLLQLSNGRWISPEIATRERPIELAALGLWAGLSAEEQAHQQAVERREAERRREREQAEEQQREADRRRAEAQAREREAQRRKKAAAEARRRAERDAPLHERQAREAAARAETVRQQRAARGPTPEQDEHESQSEPEPEPPAIAKRVEIPAEPARASERPLLPEELLLEAIREELRLVRADNGGLVSNRLLQTLVLGEPRRRGSLFRHENSRLELDVAHPLFTAVLEGYLDDPGLLTLLSSAAYSYLNLVHPEIEDAHEAEFIRRHAAYAATGLGSDPE